MTAFSTPQRKGPKSPARLSPPPLKRKTSASSFEAERSSHVHHIPPEGDSISVEACLDRMSISRAPIPASIHVPAVFDGDRGQMNGFRLERKSIVRLRRRKQDRAVLIADLRRDLDVVPPGESDQKDEESQMQKRDSSSTLGSRRTVG